MTGRFAVGVTAGKFWPPHVGHLHLLEAGLDRCDRLVAMVCDHPSQHEPVGELRAMPGRLRAAWLRDAVPDPRLEVVVVPDHCGHASGACPDDCSDVWADTTRRALADLGLPTRPDAAFTSERYGDGWAARLGCEHVLVDLERSAHPISATRVRDEPGRHWPAILPAARQHLARRIVVLGAESTGTTTLSLDLAEALGAPWVTEFGRDHAAAKVAEQAPADGMSATWDDADFVTIATEQQRLIDTAARAAEPRADGRIPVVVADTDALATAIWAERYLGHPVGAVTGLAAANPPDLYVLTADDIPFVQDGTRDGQHLRAWMTDRFRQALAAQPAPWIEVAGSLEERVAQVVDRLA